MKGFRLALAAAILVVILAVAILVLPRPRPRPAFVGISIAELASGKPHPSIGLDGPFPAWAPLPEKGLVTGAEVVVPQPPYGASAVALIKIDGDVDHFMASYGGRLAASGFRVRRVPPQVGPLFDTPQAQFQADDRQGHAVYLSFRGDASSRFVQLTYWSPPAPRLLP